MKARVIINDTRRKARTWATDAAAAAAFGDIEVVEVFEGDRKLALTASGVILFAMEHGTAGAYGPWMRIGGRGGAVAFRFRCGKATRALASL